MQGWEIFHKEFLKPLGVFATKTKISCYNFLQAKLSSLSWSFSSSSRCLNVFQSYRNVCVCVCLWEIMKATDTQKRDAIMLPTFSLFLCCHYFSLFFFQTTQYVQRISSVCFWKIEEVLHFSQYEWSVINEKKERIITLYHFFVLCFFKNENWFNASLNRNAELLMTTDTFRKRKILFLEWLRYKKCMSWMVFSKRLSNVKYCVGEKSSIIIVNAFSSLSALKKHSININTL